MTTTLERAARAAYEVSRKHDISYDPDHTTAWAEIARAVLMAVREPDGAMRQAAEKNEGCGCPCCCGADDWKGMIDAILNEEQG